MYYDPKLLESCGEPDLPGAGSHEGVASLSSVENMHGRAVVSCDMNLDIAIRCGNNCFQSNYHVEGLEEGNCDASLPEN